MIRRLVREIDCELKCQPALAYAPRPSDSDKAAGRVVERLYNGCVFRFASYQSIRRCGEHSEAGRRGTGDSKRLDNSLHINGRLSRRGVAAASGEEDELVVLVRLKVKRVGERLNGVGEGVAALPSFKRTDCITGEPCAFGQRLLAEPSAFAVVP
jgi:hypothetical protein